MAASGGQIAQLSPQPRVELLYRNNSGGEPMSPCKLVLSTFLAGIFVAYALSQTVNPLPPVRGGHPGSTTGNNPSATHPKKEPCWEVAGISKTAMEQRHALARQAKQEVEAVCANSSLTLQQKHEEIRAIHEREKQQVNALVTPQQEEAMKACQASRGHGGGHGGFGGGGHGMGPCGEMPSAIPGGRGTTPPRATTPPTKGTPPAADKDEED